MVVVADGGFAQQMLVEVASLLQEVNAAEAAKAASVARWRVDEQMPAVRNPDRSSPNCQGWPGTPGCPAKSAAQVRRRSKARATYRSSICVLSRDGDHPLWRKCRRVACRPL